MKKRVFLFCALGILLSLSLGTAIFGTSGARANEVQAKFPTKFSDSVLGQIAAWFDSRFFLRQELISAHADVNALLQSSGSTEVILGKDGWLFFGQEQADFSGAAPMTDEELAAAAKTLADLRDACAERGMDFVFLCAPNKSTVYPEQMGHPGTGALHDYQRLYALLNEMGIKTVDILPRFREADAQLYFAHDSHWNSRGAALAADLLLEALGMESRYAVDSFPAEAPHTGDLYEMLYPGRADAETDPQFGGQLSYDFRESSGTKPDSITIRTQGQGTKSLLMYRDSFGNSLYPFLADAFGTACFSRATAYDPDKEPADVMVIELVERNLKNLIQ